MKDLLSSLSSPLQRLRSQNEAMQVYDKLVRPKTWSPRDFLTVLLFALHCWGAFVLGEIVTRRGTLVGYTPADTDL